MNVDDLFRKEALEYSEDRIEGSIVLTKVPSFMSLLLLLLTFTVVLIGFVSFAPFSNNITVKGSLQSNSGVYKVFTPNEAIIETIFVQEGQRVSEGDEVFQLSQRLLSNEDGLQLTDTIEEIRYQIQNLEKQLQHKKDDHLAEQKELALNIDNVDKRIEAAEKKIGILRQRITISEQLYQQKGKLLNNGGVSQIEITESYLETLRIQESLHDLEIQLIDLAEQKFEISSELERSSGIFSSEQVTINNQISTLRQSLVNQQISNRFIIRAHRSGEVSNIVPNVGDTVSKDFPLLSIVPFEYKLQAELYIPSRAIGFVEENQRVRLSIDAFPSELYGEMNGVITQVSDVLLFPNEWQNPLSVEEPIYRVIVELNAEEFEDSDSSIKIRNGLGLEANITLETMTLLDYFTNPLREINKRFS